MGAKPPTPPGRGGVRRRLHHNGEDLLRPDRNPRHYNAHVGCGTGTISAFSAAAPHTRGASNWATRLLYRACPVINYIPPASCRRRGRRQPVGDRCTGGVKRRAAATRPPPVVINLLSRWSPNDLGRATATSALRHATLVGRHRCLGRWDLRLNVSGPNGYSTTPTFPYPRPPRPAPSCAR